MSDFNKYINLIITFLYTLLFVPLALIRILFKSIKNPKYLHRITERFALISNIYNTSNKLKCIDIWFHTVSVGEFIAAKPLIINILKQRPEYELLITCTTPTGSELINNFILDCNKLNNNFNIKHTYYPYDSNIICSRFLKIFKPKLAVFLETEIWPKMFKQIKKNNIKLYIINARLSEKSYIGYSKFKSYVKNVINHIDFIAAQGKDDLDRFIKLGYKSNQINIAVYGNIKYNLNIPDDLAAKTNYYKNLIFNINNNKLILIAASTHNGEEEIILNIFINLKKIYPSLVLIIAPRHPERFELVYNLCLNHCPDLDSDVSQKTVLKFTQITAQGRDNSAKYNPDIFILDTIGQLLYFYNLSDLAFIGGSLVPVGGHNPIEPASLSVPSIIGPNYNNFNDIVFELIQAEGMIIAKSNLDLEENIAKLLDNQSFRRSMGSKARLSIMKRGNILGKYIDLLLNYNN